MTIAKAIEELERLLSSLGNVRSGKAAIHEITEWPEIAGDWIADHGPDVVAALRAQGEPRCTDCTDAQQCAAYERGVVAGRRAPRAVPEGYVLVPVEPTEAMLVELFRGYTTREEAYRAMLAAAKEGKS